MPGVIDTISLTAILMPGVNNTVSLTAILMPSVINTIFLRAIKALQVSWRNTTANRVASGSGQTDLHCET